MPKSAEPRSKNSFRVEFTGPKLSAASQRRIAAAVEKATLNELATLDLGGDFQIRRVRQQWLGIWIDRVRRLPGRNPAGIPR